MKFASNIKFYINIVVEPVVPVEDNNNTNNENNNNEYTYIYGISFKKALQTYFFGSNEIFKNHKVFI